MATDPLHNSTPETTALAVPASRHAEIQRDFLDSLTTPPNLQVRLKARREDTLIDFPGNEAARFFSKPQTHSA